MKEIYVLFGAPGSGKSTQNELLKKYFEEKNIKYKFLEAGASFRNLIKTLENKEFAEKVRIAVERGDILPSIFPCAFLLNKFAEVYSEDVDVYLLDGYGRKLVEAQLILCQFTKWVGIEKINVIFLDVHREETHKRLSQRNRKDDVTKVIEHRLKQYEDEEEGTLASISYLKKQDFVKIYTIDGLQSIENVFKDILENIKL